MSRLAKKSVKLAPGIVVFESGGLLVFKGKLGELELRLPPAIAVEINNEGIMVRSKNSAAGDSALLGSFWSLAKNAVSGVAEGFSKVMEMEGVGYRAVLEGKELVLFLGYAQPVRIAIPDNVKVEIEKNVVIKVSGIDKELVGRFAAQVRALKKPEPYKGKGIHYRGEVIRRKIGKKAGATATAA